MISSENPIGVDWCRLGRLVYGIYWVVRAYFRQALSDEAARLCIATPPTQPTYPPGCVIVAQIMWRNCKKEGERGK